MSSYGVHFIKRRRSESSIYGTLQKSFSQNYLHSYFHINHSAFFTKSWHDKLNLNGQVEVTIPELSYPSKNDKNSRREFVVFRSKFFHSCLDYIIRDTDFTLLLPILLKQWLLSFKKNGIKVVAVL